MRSANVNQRVPLRLWLRKSPGTRRAGRVCRNRRVPTRGKQSMAGAHDVDLARRIEVEPQHVWSSRGQPTEARATRLS